MVEGEDAEIERRQGGQVYIPRHRGDLKKYSEKSQATILVLGSRAYNAP